MMQFNSIYHVPALIPMQSTNCKTSNDSQGREGFKYGRYKRQ